MKLKRCKACRSRIKTMCFKNTDACSELCQKYLDGKINKEQWTERRLNSIATR